jgi:hypothetical protein
MTTPTPNDAVKMPTHSEITNHLFDIALKIHPTDVQLAARQVIGLLTDCTLYALTSSKHDPVVFLVEVLVNLIAVSSEDENARRELLKYISDMLAQIAQQPADAPPPGTPQPSNGQPQQRQAAGMPSPMPFGKPVGKP